MGVKVQDLMLKYYTFRFQKNTRAEINLHKILNSFAMYFFFRIVYFFGPRLGLVAE